MIIDEDNTFITSDLHFFHKNIIKYCNRPYEMTDEGVMKMNEDMLAEFYKLPKDCLVINNGDVVLNYSLKEEQIQSLVSAMKNGTRTLWLILGNHDREIGKHLKRKEESLVNFWERMGFDLVLPFPTLISTDLNSYEQFLFSHEPILLNPSDDLINVHGHIHDLNASDHFEDVQLLDPEKYINVCWDYQHKFLTFKDLKNLVKS